MPIQLTAVFMKVPESYVAFVEELPSANTQAGTKKPAKILMKPSRWFWKRIALFQKESIAGAEVIREKLILPAA